MLALKDNYTGSKHSRKMVQSPDAEDLIPVMLLEELPPGGGDEASEGRELESVMNQHNGEVEGEC